MPEPTTLLDIPGLSGLGRACRNFGVQFTAYGGIVRRYLTAVIREYDAGISLFELSPFLSDIDLVHTGGSELTPHILRYLQTDIPFAECFRWELKSVDDNQIFWQAAQNNGIIPANLMSLSTNAGDGIVDPWNGRWDIEDGAYRYIRNGFYSRSPLFQEGRDLEFFSALLYLRLLLEENVTEEEFESQPGWSDAAEVFNDAGTQDTIARLQESAYLRSRLRYILKSVAAAGYGRATLDAMKGQSGLGDLLRRLDSYCLLANGYPQPQIIGFEDELNLAPDNVVVSSGRIAGDLFRLPHFTPRWDAGDAAEATLNTLLGHSAVEPEANRSRSLGDGQRVLLASPPLPLQPGISPSSRINETVIEEFVHFAIPIVGTTATQAVKGGVENLAVVLSVTASEPRLFTEQTDSTQELETADSTDETENSVGEDADEPETFTTFFPLTAACGLKGWASEEDADGFLLTIRTNCGAIPEIAHDLFARWRGALDPEMRLFVLQWTGE